jgi:hypothetical protein
LPTAAAVRGALPTTTEEHAMSNDHPQDDGRAEATKAVQRSLDRRG